MKNNKTSSILEKLLENVPDELDTTNSADEFVDDKKEPTEDDEEEESLAVLNKDKVKQFQRGFKKSSRNIG